MNRYEIARLLQQSTYTCQTCNGEYRPKRLNSKFCSTRCSNKAAKAIYRKTDKGKAAAKRSNERGNERKRKWSRAQPSYYHLTRTREYQTKKKGLTPKLSTIEQMMIQNYYEDAALLTKQTGIPHEVDHIIPLARYGWHHPFNLRVVTRDVNRSKGARI